MRLLALALAPALILLAYVYIRDRYEKEPWRLLIVGVIFGVTITYPIIQVENLITSYLPVTGILGEALYSGFCVAAFTETAFKFTVLFLLTWNNRNLNERFDGIVYSVFIALGFAGLENVLYVFHDELGGAQTALIRAALSVPAHMLFAVTTGYFFAMAKFVPERKAWYLAKAFFVTWFIHGAYDFVLLSDTPHYLLLLVPLMAWMWRNGLRQMKKHIGASPFKHLKKIGPDN
jgi:RsiW-degrading membrane proteinase PrsW (M82 family)